MPANPLTAPVIPATELAHSDELRAAAAELASELDRPEAEVAAEAAADVEEMRAGHAPLPLAAWRRLGRRLLRNYTVHTDTESLARLRELGKDHTLVWMPSHRSYLDTWVLPEVLQQNRIPPFYVIGGINLDFFPFGQLARRTGLVFIRRDIKDDPVYRFALRRHLADLVRRRAGFGWSIEGGRSRTGKLRPPRYGLLRYLAAAVQESGDRSVLLVPASVVYDDLPEVSLMAAEALGAKKESEGVGWLVDFARRQSASSGNVHIDFGEPIPLADRLEELEGEEDGKGHEVERVALELCHNINRATPIVPVAAVTVGLLAAGRALTLDETVEAVRSLSAYFEQRGCPIASSRRLEDRTLVAKTLDTLVRTRAAVRYDGGSEPVWNIGADQALVAAFYRNSALHCLIERAVAELASEAVAAGEDNGSDRREAVHREALRLRELLKFDFFFPRQDEFLEHIDTELEIDARAPDLPRIGPLVLRPFLESYLVVAEQLAAANPGHRLHEKAFLDDCLGVAHQWLLQRRLSSAESISLELFKTAMRLARHRDLIGPGGTDLAAARQRFARELADTLVQLGPPPSGAPSAPGSPLWEQEIPPTDDAAEALRN